MSICIRANKPIVPSYIPRINAIGGWNDTYAISQTPYDAPPFIDNTGAMNQALIDNATNVVAKSYYPNGMNGWTWAGKPVGGPGVVTQQIVDDFIPIPDLILTKQPNPFNPFPPFVWVNMVASPVSPTNCAIIIYIDGNGPFICAPVIGI